MLTQQPTGVGSNVSFGFSVLVLGFRVWGIHAALTGGEAEADGEAPDGQDPRRHRVCGRYLGVAPDLRMKQDASKTANKRVRGYHHMVIHHLRQQQSG